MVRSLIIVLGALALGAGLFIGSFAASQRVCRACVAEPPGSLSWLQGEYHLNNEQMQRIQQLHNNYLSHCKMMCRIISAKQQDAAMALNNATNVSPAAQQKLNDLAVCRTRCQAQMFQYFINVSRVMPPDQGRRYLAEMEKNTLGFTSK